jgi:hypothetical protein
MNRSRYRYTLQNCLEIQGREQVYVCIILCFKSIKILILPVIFKHIYLHIVRAPTTCCYILHRDHQDFTLNTLLIFCLYK